MKATAPMQPNVQEQYLNTKILTATPQKLHLMLIERAIHHARLAKEIWNTSDRLADRDEAITKCIHIVGELLIGVRDSHQSVARQVAGVYAFLLRTITEAKLLNDVTKLDDAHRILAIERETWQQVCEKYGDTQIGDHRDQVSGHPLPGMALPPHGAYRSMGFQPAPFGDGGLSLEA